MFLQSTFWLLDKSAFCVFCHQAVPYDLVLKAAYVSGFSAWQFWEVLREHPALPTSACGCPTSSPRKVIVLSPAETQYLTLEFYLDKFLVKSSNMIGLKWVLSLIVTAPKMILIYYQD